VIWCTVLPVRPVDPHPLLAIPPLPHIAPPRRPTAEILPTRSTPPPPPTHPARDRRMISRPATPAQDAAPRLSPGGGTLPPPDGAGEARCPPGGAVVASGYHGGTCTERFSLLNPTAALVTISPTHLSVLSRTRPPASAPVAARCPTGPPTRAGAAWALPLGAGAGSVAAAAAMDKRMLGDLDALQLLLLRPPVCIEFATLTCDFINQRSSRARAGHHGWKQLVVRERPHAEPSHVTGGVHIR
jgi:hypothetical protein